jgi:hypothetical protein
VTDEPVEDDNPDDGFHAYELPPVAVKETDCPLHSIGDKGFTAIVGVITYIE